MNLNTYTIDIICISVKEYKNIELTCKNVLILPFWFHWALRNNLFSKMPYYSSAVHCIILQNVL